MVKEIFFNIKKHFLYISDVLEENLSYDTVSESYLYEERNLNRSYLHLIIKELNNLLNLVDFEDPEQLEFIESFGLEGNMRGKFQMSSLYGVLNSREAWRSSS